MNVTSQVDFAKQLKAAQEAAAVATSEYIKENGENPMGCGFAWVTIKNIRGKKLDYLKVNGFKKKYDGPGFSFWNPSKNITQDMDAKYAGALVYAEELNKMGIPAYADCRLD